MDVPPPTGNFFGPPEQPLSGWLSASASTVTSSGVLILPGLGYEYWTAHRMLRTLGESLAAQGHLVMRMEYRGIGDSSGDQWDIESVAAWKDDIGAGVAELRRLGAASVAVVGVRLSALLALQVADSLGLVGVVAWAPPESGRRFAKELRLLSQSAPEDVEAVGGPGARFLAGVVFSGDLLSSIAELVVDSLVFDGRPVLLLDRIDRPANARLADAIRAGGAELTHCVLAGAERFLDVPTEYATVSEDQVEAISAWMTRFFEGASPISLLSATAQARWRASAVGLSEQVIAIGAHRLAAIQTTAVIAAGDDPVTVVFLNTGSEHHVGAGRIWVEFGRRLAALGHQAIRVDFRGWGDSPDDGCSPGRPFDQHGVDDVRDVVRALRTRGDGRIVLVGLCASAWIVLRDCWNLDVDGVLAFNPPLDWQVGDPIDATIAESKLRRAREHPHEVLLARLGVWRLLDAVGIKQAGREWIGQLAAAPFPVEFAYAADDDGLEYLDRRLGRTMARALRRGSLRLVRLQRVDHSMHLHWHRDEAFAVVAGFVDRVQLRPPRA